MNRRDIFDAVMDAMQPAEEIGGPTGLDYLILMAQIAREASDRIENHANGRMINTRKPLTLEEFRRTGRNVRFEDEIGATGGMTKYGRMYAGGCYIQLRDDGDWLLVICNADYKDRDLRMLEQRLYEDWYVQFTNVGERSNKP